jgi:prevent-host-death family protein
MTRQIKASEFKAKCLALMDEVAHTGNSVVITKKGKPVADLVPHRLKKRSPFGILKDSVKITGDIISPIDVEWEALKLSCSILMSPSGLQPILRWESAAER